MIESYQNAVAGVDGCRQGWAVAAETASGRIAVEVVSNFKEILDRDYAVAVVDIPIGLLTAGTRVADTHARLHLKSRACCVFTAPLRSILACPDYSAARNSRLAIEGKSMSKQAWAIVPKIQEVDKLLTPANQINVREGHPEISFAQMNGTVLTASKHTPEGKRQRVSLLSKHFSNIAGDVQQHVGIALDVIDAYAMLWTAQRIRTGTAIAMPAESSRDSHGFLMQIWA